MSERTVIVNGPVRCGCSTECWRARCSECEDWLSKHDLTESSARRSGLDALASHVCTEPATRPRTYS